MRPEDEHRHPPRRPPGGDQHGDPEGQHECADVAHVVRVLDPVVADLVEEGVRRDQGEGAGGGIEHPDHDQHRAHRSLADHPRASTFTRRRDTSVDPARRALRPPRTLRCYPPLSCQSASSSPTRAP